MIKKDQLLIETRGVSFLDAITAIEQQGVLLGFTHPNPEKFPGQHILVVNIDGYAYCGNSGETCPLFRP